MTASCLQFNRTSFDTFFREPFFSGPLEARHGLAQAYP